MTNFCYHGIETNLLRYESILKYGILTKKSGANCTTFNSNSSQSFNGDTNISIVIPHSDTNSGAIKTYIFEGISFLITNEEYSHAYYTNSYSGIFDEGYVNHPIPPSNLSGIIIPTYLRNKRISELSVFGKASLDSISSIAQSVVNTLVEKGIDPKSFTDTQELMACYDSIYNDTDLSYYQRNQAIEQIQNKLDANLGQKLESYYQKQLGKQDITLMDVIDFYNQSHLPIYDENDVQKQCKGYTTNIPQYIRDSGSNNKLSKNYEIETIPESIKIDLNEDFYYSFLKIAFTQKASHINTVRNTVLSHINQLHDKEKSLR